MAIETIRATASIELTFEDEWNNSNTRINIRETLNEILTKALSDYQVEYAKYAEFSEKVQERLADFDIKISL